MPRSRHSRTIGLRINPISQHNQITALANLNPNRLTPPLQQYNPTIALRHSPTLRPIHLRTHDVRIVRPQRVPQIRLQ